MDTTTINGLHSCKPGNDPIVGQVKLFVIQHMTSKKGKPYIKIKSANEENGGTPHRILVADKTDFVDQHGNISFNMEVEATTAQPSAFQQTKAAMQGEPPGWEAQPPLDERQRAIIRQHSQSMALEVLKLKVTLNELTVADLTPSKLGALADYFDQDVYKATE